MEQAPEQARAPKKRQKVPPKLIVAAVVLVIALIFVLQNTAKVNTNFLWMEFTSSLWFSLNSRGSWADHRRRRGLATRRRAGQGQA